MRNDLAFPGVSGPKSGLCRWGLTTRDSVRQETPGAPAAGAGDKGPTEKLRAESWARPPEAAHLIYS